MQKPPGRRPVFAVVVAAVPLLLSGCAEQAVRGDATPAATASSTPPQPAPAPGSTSPPSIDSGTTVMTGDSDYGTMLFDANGQAIYLFDKETTSRADCYGDCAADWPPVLTTAAPAAGGAVRADLLGTTPRDDGTTQVTYGGHPLYFYAHEGPNQVLCHNVVEYGGRWLVVTPEGSAAPY